MRAEWDREMEEALKEANGRIVRLEGEC